MRIMTAENLRAAFGGESQAHMRYSIWADKAEKEGFKNVARLFRAISRAEKVHAQNHFRVLKNVEGDFSVTSAAGFGDTNTSDNLEKAYQGEVFEYTEMYPAYIKVAEENNEKAAVASMQLAIAAEEIHASYFKKAKEAVDEGKDLDIGTIYVCPVCGWIGENPLEDKCPICKRPKESFLEF